MEHQFSPPPAPMLVRCSRRAWRNPPGVRAVAFRPAIEVRWTIDLEREIDCRKQRIDPIGWQWILRILHQAQRVNRKVAVLIYGDMQGFGIGGVDLCLNGDDVANALTALD